MSQPAFTSLGGYPILYLDPNNNALCAKCAGDHDVGDVYWEGEPIQCDECNANIESAYGPVENDHASE